MSIKLATHLYRNRHGTFYFRLALPRDLRNHVQQNEIRFSLHTEQRHVAIPSAALLVAGLPDLIADLRRMAENHETTPPDYFVLWREQMFKNTSLSAQVKLLKTEVTEQQERMAQMVPRDKAMSAAKRAGKIMHERGQLRGKQEIEERLVFPWLPEKTTSFSTLKAAYLKSLVNNRAGGGAKKPPNQNTLKEYGRALDSFIAVMGDCQIGAIDKEAAGEYFSILRRLPANINMKPKYRGKTIPELLALGDPPQKESTCSKKIERISFMFKWALEEKRKWGIDANPFTGFGQAASNTTTRRPFTPDELLALLNHPDFVRRKFTNSYTFWLIPLATYTGARLGELAQLDLKDFIEVDGISCIDINDVDAVETVEGDGNRKKRLKTKSAKRLVPIHSELIRIGLLRHVERLRQGGQLQVFPELSRRRRGGAAHAASKWFGRFRKSAGVNAKQEAVFHSFRHLFITTILDSGVSEHMVAPIVGHEATLITGKVYWDKKDATKRKPTVEAFALADHIRQLFPTIEEVTLTPRRGPHPGRLRGAVTALDHADKDAFN